MLNQRHCFACGSPGPFARVVTQQDPYGDISGYLCLCMRCSRAISEAEFRQAILTQTQNRVAKRRLPIGSARREAKVSG